MRLLGYFIFWATVSGCQNTTTVIKELPAGDYIYDPNEDIKRMSRGEYAEYEAFLLNLQNLVSE